MEPSLQENDDKDDYHQQQHHGNDDSDYDTPHNSPAGTEKIRRWQFYKFLRTVYTILLIK